MNVVVLRPIADATPLVDLWFNARQIADARLPGLPRQKNKVNEFARDQKWALRCAADGTELARSRKVRGGITIEYHVDLLPPSARAKMLEQYQPEPAPKAEAANDAKASIWSWFELQSQATRDKAAQKLALVLEIERLVATGSTVTAAIATVAAMHGVGVSTLNNWRSPLLTIPRSDWLPHLADRYVGGGKAVAVDPEIWKMLVSQYLLPAEQPWYACYKDAEIVANARGIRLPHWRTLLRKFEREIDPLLAIKCREGVEALERALPSVTRDVSHLHAMQKVNIDGHLWDVRVIWPDGTVGRPMMVAIQDIYSRKMLAWNIDKSENSVSVRKAFQKLLATYGVPLSCLCDNGRAFASKWISGGSDTRNRFTIRPDDPLGLLPALGVQVEWAQPYHGQSKPIERSFGLFCNRIAKCPEFHGFYTGRSPLHKPHNHDHKRAIPVADFIEVLERRIEQVNAEGGRKTQMAAGKRSVDEVFAESYASAPIGKATPEALALALMDAKKAKIRRDGTVHVEGNQYWELELSRRIGEEVIVRYDPDDLKADARIYTLAGKLVAVAFNLGTRGFDQISAATEIKKLRSDVRKLVKKQDEALDRLSAAQIAEEHRQYYAEPDLPEASVVRPVRHRGQTAAALKPVSAPSQRRLIQTQAAAVFDELAAARRMRAQLDE
jgi:putative transposase